MKVILKAWALFLGIYTMILLVYSQTAASPEERGCLVYMIPALGLIAVFFAVKGWRK